MWFFHPEPQIFMLNQERRGARNIMRWCCDHFNKLYYATWASLKAFEQSDAWKKKRTVPAISMHRTNGSLHVNTFYLIIPYFMLTFSVFQSRTGIITSDQHRPNTTKSKGKEARSYIALFDYIMLLCYRFCQRPTVFNEWPTCRCVCSSSSLGFS